MVDKDDVSSPSLGDFVADVVYGIDPYIIHDGAKYHKSSLVNSILNSSTKLLSSDRYVRSITNQSVKSHQNMEADDGDYFIISDTIATIAKVKSSSELVAVIVVVDKINYKNEFVSSVSHDDMHECKFHGKVPETVFDFSRDR